MTLANGRRGPARPVEPDQLPKRVAERLRYVRQHSTAGDSEHPVRVGLRYEQVVDHRNGGPLDRPGCEVEWNREQPLPSCVQQVSTWRVAGKKTTVHDPPHLACRQV